MKKEYIYLNTNPDNEDVIKVGKTTKKPILRAKEMDKKSHNVNDWIVEKYWEVFDCTIAEKIAHYCLQEYVLPEKRELFKINKEQAIEILDKNLTVFSCLMGKNEIENIFFENQKYIAELEGKIQDLENNFKIVSNTEREIYQVELQLVEMLLEDAPNDNWLLYQRTIYKKIENLITSSEFLEGDSLKKAKEELIKLKQKANLKKIDTQEMLLKQKQDVLEFLAIVDDDDDKEELENELLKIEKALKVLSFNNSDNMLNDKDLFEFRLEITDEMLLEDTNNQKLLEKRDTLREINTLFVASQFLEGEDLENIKKLIIKLDKKSKEINS